MGVMFRGVCATFFGVGARITQENRAPRSFGGVCALYRGWRFRFVGSVSGRGVRALSLGAFGGCEGFRGSPQKERPGFASTIFKGVWIDDKRGRK